MSISRALPFLVVLCVACGEDRGPDKMDSAGGFDSGILPMDVDWGSWQLTATPGSESEACSDMGAGAGNMNLYAEVAVAAPDFISLQLGTRFLSGTRDRDGFEASGDEFIPPANTDGTGIFVRIDASEASWRAFSGALVYDIVSQQGHCTISLDTVGEWMYYEPPPPCTG